MATDHVILIMFYKTIIYRRRRRKPSSIIIYYCKTVAYFRLFSIIYRKAQSAENEDPRAGFSRKPF